MPQPCQIAKKIAILIRMPQGTCTLAICAQGMVAELVMFCPRGNLLSSTSKLVFQQPRIGDVWLVPCAMGIRVVLNLPPIQFM